MIRDPEVIQQWRAEQLLRLVRDRFGETAARIGYARDDDDTVLWDIRDGDGALLWDARPDDIPEWEQLGEAVDLFARLIEDNPERGDALIFDLTIHQPTG